MAEYVELTQNITNKIVGILNAQGKNEETTQSRKTKQDKIRNRSGRTQTFTHEDKVRLGAPKG